MKELKTTLMDKAKWACRWFFIVLGIFFFLLFLLSFTSLPYYAYRSLSMESQTLSSAPDVIVILGGSGMPSPDGLMRTYCATEQALAFKQAKIIIALPYSGVDSLFQLNLMAHELIIRGVDSMRISFEPLGFNTHSQAENIAVMLQKNRSNLNLLLVSSPEHLFRAVKSFEKVGFNRTGAAPAFDVPVEEERIKDKLQSTDTRIKNLALRYNLWSYLNYELFVIREYCAITYYKMKGWI
jgi:uncharacterized SAM-binding protein YcdF (DUF218 family)